MADCVLKDNLFEFDCKFYQQISGTAIWAKFAPPYASVFMDYVETEFLKTQAKSPGYALMISSLFGHIPRKI